MEETSHPQAAGGRCLARGLANRLSRSTVSHRDKPRLSPCRSFIPARPPPPKKHGGASPSFQVLFFFCSRCSRGHNNLQSFVLVALVAVPLLTVAISTRFRLSSCARPIPRKDDKDKERREEGTRIITGKRHFITTQANFSSQLPGCVSRRATCCCSHRCSSPAPPSCRARICGAATPSRRRTMSAPRP
jgi:hypothetical protein